MFAAVSVPLRVGEQGLTIYAVHRLGRLRWYNRFKLYQWKAERIPAITELAARQLAWLVGAVYGGGWTMLTVPPYSTARQSLGYYPAGELGKALSVLLGVDFVTMFNPVTEKYIRKRMGFKWDRKHDPQLTRQVVGERILLVDDVMMTGRTLKACYDLLSKHNAVDVAVWVKSGS